MQDDELRGTPPLPSASRYSTRYRPSPSSGAGVDEIGYLPVSRTGAMHFCQLMSRCYEQASTVLTSNEGFDEWGGILGDAVTAAALIDRLLHHCHIVDVRGDSYRMRAHSQLWRTPHLLPEGDPASASSPRRRIPGQRRFRRNGSSPPGGTLRPP